MIDNGFNVILGGEIESNLVSISPNQQIMNSFIPSNEGHSRNRNNIELLCAISNNEGHRYSRLGVTSKAIMELLLNMRFFETSILSLGPRLQYLLDILGMQG